MTDDIRAIVREHAKLAIDPATLADDTDLYASGMTSHASVNVMLALEGKFDREFLEEQVVTDHLWIAADFAAARKPVAEQGQVQPLHQSVAELEELYEKARRWLEAQDVQ